VQRPTPSSAHCHAVSHHSTRPCHENGEQCPHQALFEHGEAVEVLHTHFHADDQPNAHAYAAMRCAARMANATWANSSTHWKPK